MNSSEFSLISCAAAIEHLADASLWRPHRRALLEQLEKLKRTSGRFRALINADLLLGVRERGDLTVAQLLGFEPFLTKLIKKKGVPICPACGAACARSRLEDLRSWWGDLSSGVLMIGAEIAADQCGSAASIIQMALYYGGERVSDGKSIFTIAQLSDPSFKISRIPDARWHVILDSAAAPVSVSFELSLQALMSKGTLTLLLRETTGQIRILGEVSADWCCSKCLRILSANDVHRTALAGVDTDTLFQMSFAELGNEYDELKQAVNVITEIGGAEWRVDRSIETLSLAEHALAQSVKLLLLSVQDTQIIFDDIVDLFDPTQRAAFDRLLEELRSRGNQMISISAVAAREDSPPFVEDSIVTYDKALEKGAHGYTIRDLRRESEQTFAALIGMREVLAHLLAATPDGQLLGRQLSDWLNVPLREIEPLLSGVERSSRLVRALITLGFGERMLSEQFDSFSDLERQVIRLLTIHAATHVDLYKKSKKRRQGDTRQIVFLRPFWGMSALLRAALHEQLAALKLSDDTIIYLDTRIRF